MAGPKKTIEKKDNAAVQFPKDLYVSDVTERQIQRVAERCEHLPKQQPPLYIARNDSGLYRMALNINSQAPFVVLLAFHEPLERIGETTVYPSRKPRYEVPIICKNNIHYTFLCNYLFVHCRSLIVSCVQKKYPELHEDGSVLFHYEYLTLVQRHEKHGDYVLKANEPCVDMRHWVYCKAGYAGWLPTSPFPSRDFTFSSSFLTENALDIVDINEATPCVILLDNLNFIEPTGRRRRVAIIFRNRFQYKYFKEDNFDGCLDGINEATVGKWGEGKFFEFRSYDGATLWEISKPAALDPTELCVDLRHLWFCVERCTLPEAPKETRQVNLLD
jgi:hypothetical protein